MKKLILTSCGIVNDKLKDNFYTLINKPSADLKLLYITTAVDGEQNQDLSWVDKEYQTILDLGIKKENITEFKLDHNINFRDFDAIYMMGGNTFYLLKKLRENNWAEKIKKALEQGIIYIGSSAGSIIMGSSIKTALGYDENQVKLTNLDGLELVNGLVIPHANQKQDFIEKCKNEFNEKLYIIEDNHGFIINNDNENYY